MARTIAINLSLNDGPLARGFQKAGGHVDAFREKLGGLKGVMAGAGLAGGAAFAGALAKGLDASAAQGKLKAQLGLSAQESKRIGGVAGKLYADAYGESMEDVNAAVKSVVQNMDGMRSASSADLQQTTARAMTLANVLDEDVGGVTNAVAQLMRNKLVKNSTEAFDLIAKSTQLGVNKSEDLLDTINEYSTQFREVGLSGPKAMGLIFQAVRAGARDADTAADAIKEFAIRSKNVADPNTIKGFEALHLNVKQMTRTFAAGGPAADKAFRVVIDRLKQIKNPVKQNEIAVALFGTKAEDLGKALYALDPSTAVQGLGQLKGATDNASKAMGETSAAQFEKWKRGVEAAIVSTVVGDVLPALDQLNAKLAAAGVEPGHIVKAALAIGGLTVAMKVGTVAAGGMRTAVGGASKAIGLFRAEPGGVSKASSALETLRLRAMYAGDAVKRGAIATANGAKAAVVAARANAALAVSHVRAGAAATAQAAKTAALVVWQKVSAAATKAWAAGQWLLNAAMSANPIGLVVVAVVALIAAFVLAYKKVGWFRTAVLAVWGALKTGVVFAINFVRDHWRLILPILLGPLGLFIALGTKYWAQIKGIFSAAVSWVLANVRAHWRLLVSIFLGPLGIVIALVTKYWSQIKSRTLEMLAYVRQKIASGLAAARAIVSSALSITLGIFARGYNSIKSRTSEFMGSVRSRVQSGINATKAAFSSGVAAIGHIWDRLRDITRRPVSFFVNTVYNGGVRKVWGAVRKLVPALPDLPAVHFASGGVLPGYAPGRDTVMAMLSPGEGILRPEAVKALGHDWINGVNHSARRGGVDAVTRLVAGVGDPGGLPGFAGGGIVGILKKPANWIKNAAGPLMSKGVDWFAKSVLNPILHRIPGGTSLWERALSAVPHQLIDSFLAWIKKTVAPNMGGRGSQAAVNAARTQIGVPYSWGGGGLGGPSYGIAQGAGTRGFDCSSLMQYAWGKASDGKDITRTTYSQRGFLRTISHPVVGAVGQPHAGHTYMYSGDGKIVEAQQTGTRISEHNLYRSTPWWGLPPWVMDNGGALPPRSLSLIHNASGRSEMVMSGAQQDLIAGAAGGGNTYNITVQVAPGGNTAEAARQVVSLIKEYERRNGRGWRT
ncbi:phage tail tape measure protein [Actinomadura sp. NEAU-AAG7]|uniref:phage tail tape measure protein n=1 Tax=Actinomadura sp. NEAU-AAG7 TaxID=2839640 RepID=UPI001BE3D479|nr:phage tail tape measure protein [Actinomadura sp. NEAU-AAG7]MBT2213456.1 phage tail tape measure protein [Actinomadura sp. NEAU-AAG7]